MTEKREIKFRVWNKRTKQLTQPHAISEELLNNEELEVMQFTGLFDKNGQEIFEGDIMDTRYGKEIVRWHKNSAGFAPFTYSANAPDNETECEIIGNIYENPDLRN